MKDPFVGLADALDCVRQAWSADGAAPSSARGLDRARLVGALDALGALRRHVDALQADVAAEVARESRKELGADSLAKQHGFRSPELLIAATTGMTAGDAARLVRVGQAIEPGMSLCGEEIPAKHPYVAAAVRAGLLGVPAASAIITMLDRVAIRADHAAVEQAEHTLVEQAAGLGLDLLVKVIARAEAWLDADGIEPKERAARAERAVHVFERDGMIHLTGVFDPESGAPVKAVLEGFVSAAFRVARDAHSESELPSVPQLQADALTTLAWHALGCTDSDVPLDGATVVVRTSLEDLAGGSGVATIDGIAQPVSISAVRRLAAGGGVIPCVLGAGSEILDWGREKRLFTRAQKLALAERDGGCAFCALPPAFTRAHHLRWWARDGGPTDLDNGVLLCESCHHRVHDNGWDIRIEGIGIGAKVWFIPPPHVDPARTPRLGGRARYDFAA